MRSALSWIAGVVAGGITVGLVEMLSHLVWPPPEGVDFADPAAVQALLATLPLGALVALVVAWFGGALVGSTVTMVLCRNAAVGWAAGAMTVLGTVANLAMLPHPLWMTVLGPVAAVAGTVLGPWLVLKLQSQRPDALR